MGYSSIENVAPLNLILIINKQQNNIIICIPFYLFQLKYLVHVYIGWLQPQLPFLTK